MSAPVHRDTTSERPAPYTPTVDATRPLAPAGTKWLVAVHGIGDQTAYETIQSVALRVGAHLGQPVATPLGRFYLNPDGAPVPDAPEPTPQFMTARDPGRLAGFGLAEAYWAPISRDVATKKYVLEETKRWARSVAGRVAYRGGAANHWSERKVERLVVVLDEMVETIRILERLTFLAEKAGVFKFDLGKLLVDFVGDVQLVADFQVYREKIIKRFDATMTAMLDRTEGGDGNLYIVAHSEGTVVTFVALLEALARPNDYPWIKKVRGLMTIGSPIEIHHLLWPALWQETLRQPSPDARGIKIPWHNYMDYGDPIAYELPNTTHWLETTHFADHLTPVTHAFSRYPLPGKAHVDYWADKDVFGHFFETVVGLDPRRRWLSGVTDLAKRPVKFVTRAKGDVRSKLWVPVVAFVLPYILVAGLLMTGAYALEHAVSAAFGADFAKDLYLSRVVADVMGIGILMFGITAAARLPRISDSRRWSASGWMLLAVAMFIFGFIASVPTQLVMGGPLASWFGVNAATCAFRGLPFQIGCDSGAGIGHATIAVWVASVLVAAVSGLWTKLFPRRGHFMLPALGLVAAANIVGAIWLAGKDKPDVSLGPVLIAGIAFFYLWWLSALLFDLVFIWRRYARHSAVRDHLAGMATNRVASP